MITPKFLLLTPIAISLAACSGGGGGSFNNASGGGQTPGTPSTYETLSSRAASTSNLKGTALRVPRGGTVSTVDVSGQLTHNTGAISVSDGTSSVTASARPTTGNQYRQGTRTLTEINLDGSANPAPYEYVSVFNLDDSATGSSTAGVYGIATNPADVPTSGNVTYRGQAEVAALRNGPLPGAAQLLNGESTVNANFATGTVDVEMTNFRQSRLQGTYRRAPLDTMTVQGMRISGNEFSGGTVATSLNGRPVDLAGTGAQQSAEGVFYGRDQGLSAPDEVGGIASITNGTRAAVIGVFVAD